MSEQENKLTIFDFLEDEQVTRLIINFVGTACQRQAEEGKTREESGVKTEEIEEFLSLCKAAFIITSMVEMASEGQVEIGVQDGELWFRMGDKPS